MFALCIESSHKRGMGHLYRALNLADSLTRTGIECKFYINNHSRSCQILESRAYSYTVVDLLDHSSGWEADVMYKDGIKLWINDRLDTEKQHASRIKSLNIPLVTFDDRGSGAEYADIHIAALAFDKKESLAGKRVFRGVDYLVLSSEINQHTRLRKNIKSILVTLGGSDTHGVTIQVIKHLIEQKSKATVIIGPAFEHNEELEKVVTPNFTIKRHVPSLIEEFINHDLAITGGGITPFEANASGLPCIVIANEPFEIPTATALADYGGAIFAGYHKNIDSTVFARNLAIEDMSSAGMKHITLNGCNNVLRELSNIL